MDTLFVVEEVDEPSPRVVDQRVRNRIIEVLETLACGNAAVEDMGAVEWFNSFFDWVDDTAPWDWRTLTTLDSAEIQDIDNVLDLMNEAVSATPRRVSEEQLMASGWPERVRPIAARAVERMTSRGRFSEEVEEREPGKSL